VPYIREDIPAVCAWYPEAQRVLIWNLDESPQSLTLCLNEWSQELHLGALGVEIVAL
jgi:hypothetical protein